MNKRPSRLDEFAEFCTQRIGRKFENYADLWSWSVEDLDSFWGLLWDFFTVSARDPAAPVLATAAMPGALWFPDATLNFTAETFRDRDPDQVAVVAVNEGGSQREVTWAALEAQVSVFAAYLRDRGVTSGDRVVGYLPNGVEAIVAFLATASLGATWAICGMDYAPAAAIARLSQLRPRVLVAATRHDYAGRSHDDRDSVRALAAALADLEQLVLVGEGELIDAGVPAERWAHVLNRPPQLLHPAHVPFNHPLWVLFSSGTTGMPKGIVHGHGGVVLEQLKFNALHLDMGPGDRLLWYTTPSWMMWNVLVGALLTGATSVCYDGSPGYPDTGGLWRVAERVGATLLGTSPAYLTSCRSAGVEPADVDLSSLRSVGVTGSTFSVGLYDWLTSRLPAGTVIASTSGGTDVATAFAAPSPWTSTWAGELSAACLGVALDAYDPAGSPVRGVVGELVVTRPMPSMPLYFWDDPDGSKLRRAYYSVYPGVWRHGDWITITSRNSIVIHGRSDATLNRQGIRIGSADIYAAVETLPFVAEALVVGIDEPNAGYWMPMFIATSDGLPLSKDQKLEIRATIAQQASARHVPDEIFDIPAVLHTKTGKKLEIPIKRILTGEPPDAVVDRNSVDFPDLLDVYAAVGQARLGYRQDRS